MCVKIFTGFDHLCAHFHPDSGLSQWRMVYILTVFYILTVVSGNRDDCSPSRSRGGGVQGVRTPFVKYPAVRVKIYAYVKMLGRDDLIIASNSPFSGKENNCFKPVTSA